MYNQRMNRTPTNIRYKKIIMKKTVKNQIPINTVVPRKRSDADISRNQHHTWS